MPPKRTRDDSGSPEPSPKKARRGFRVGPENLPDGPWRRKVTKIKRDLIEKAKLKKQYAKLKVQQQKLAEEEREKKRKKEAGQLVLAPPEVEEHGAAPDSHGQRGVAKEVTPQSSSEQQQEEKQQGSESQPQIHPTRQIMLEAEKSRTTQRDQKKSEVDGSNEDSQIFHDRQPHPRHRRRRSGGDFKKELAEAARKQREAEERARERARRDEERRRKVAERERVHKALVKARTPGKDGRRKLGRESVVLLDKVKKLVGQTS
ncbi:hypothetical protein VTK73DRAFT_10403 [Phialemonium thermophilum]|uniref:rRNA-processing protein FYV7 n=1 Tax=Phialemonium thermophilum TaxID=223376 RepID=A0ABR3XG34_9PEZI